MAPLMPGLDFPAAAAVSTAICRPDWRPKAVNAWASGCAGISNAAVRSA
jgi:hypothetical protein